MLYPIKESVFQNLLQVYKARLPGLGDIEFNAPKEVLDEMNFGRTDAEFAHKLSKTHLKSRVEKGVNYLNPRGLDQSKR